MVALYGIISLCLLRRMTIHKKLNLHNVMKNRANNGILHDYAKPSIEVIYVEVEGGFSISNDQEPSPWEDM